MDANQVQVRQAEERDREQIMAIHRNAFGDDEGPVICDLVDRMLGDSTSQPMFSIVAEREKQLVGHVLFTSVSVEPECRVTGQILAPLAVVSGQQGQRIGSQLVEHGLLQLSEADVGLVFVLGYPDYYGRFGFEPAGVRGLDAPYPIEDKNADAWMVKELKAGAIAETQGTVRCCRVLNDPKFWQE